MHRALIKSAAAANMNLLRIWGGGVYLFEEFTDAADEEGVMIYEDMMYGTDGIMPGAAATADQEAELRYQIRRQAHHPCIIGACVRPYVLCVRTLPCAVRTGRVGRISQGETQAGAAATSAVGAGCTRTS
jgi:hypothetical protein